MKISLKYREGIREARRVVIKIGTSSLVRKGGRPDLRRIGNLVREIAALHRSGYEVALVTSGAIGAGMEALGMTSRPTRLPELQMAAAVGQCRLMARYDRFFSARRCLVGQVLLTHDNFTHKIRMTNARRTMESLLRRKVIPIINENDVVADEEIRADLTLGDNDLLSALVAKLIRADLLVLLTTADGVLQPAGPGKLRRIPYIETVTRRTFDLVMGGPGELSRGGMGSKLRAAQTVARAGIGAVIADGRKAGVLRGILAGDDVGTLVLPSV